jgi:hypothetical protein
MIQFKGIRASDGLYKCWKRAVNESVHHLLKDSRLNGSESVYRYIEEKYQCRTLHAQKHTVDNTVRYVDLEFPSEKHVTFFMLRWS